MALNDTKDTDGNLYGLFGVHNEHKPDTQLGQESLDSHLIKNDSIEEIDSKKCCICCNDDAKYRCPSCERRTCSLSCCRSHKQTFDCNGIRKKTSYVHMKDYTQSHFISDYLFLEDADRVIDVSSRERRTIINSKRFLPKWINQLIRQARMRGTRLMIMPGGFQKRKTNTTCYMYKDRIILWDVECIFPHAVDTKEYSETDPKYDINLDDCEDVVSSNSKFSIRKHRINENTILSEFILNITSPVDLMQNYEQNRRLSLYRECGIEGISVLFKKVKNNYEELDVKKTIKENLSGKTVVEFPTFAVILNKYKHLYNIEENDCKVDNKPECIKMKDESNKNGNQFEENTVN